jgi:hypothetical protein
VPVRFLSDAQREQLSGFPAELDGEALDRFFTLSDADLAEVRRRHGDSNRLGWALQQPELRKRVGRQLNKGESLHALRETVHFAHHGNVRHRQLADQAAQALCLTLVVNCVAAFNAGLLTPAVEQLRTTGFQIDDDDVSHLGPTMTEHINVSTAATTSTSTRHRRASATCPPFLWPVTTDGGSSFRSRWFLVR